MEKLELDSLLKAGEIAKETKKYAASFIKKDMSFLEIAEKIEQFIVEKGARPAFPVNLTINEIAAHATPAYNSQEKAHGLLKVDIGVHVEGFVADTAFSMDLENNNENKALIEAAQLALEKATKEIHLNIPLRDIGKAIAHSIKEKGFQPIINLSGHSIERFNLHAGITIPNFDNTQQKPLQPGVYAIEPFVTTGLGSVRDGRPSGIYVLEREGVVRDAFARQVMDFIDEEYDYLPFCSRWLVKKFGTRALIALKRMEEAGLVHQYNMLIESGNGKVAQAEHTVIITKDNKIITT